MGDVLNFKRRLEDKIGDAVVAVLTWVWQALFVAAWLAGSIVLTGSLCRIAEYFLKPLFCFGYDILPVLGSLCRGCLK